MQDTICENVSLHFKFEGRMYSIMFKRNITLLMLKARIQRKIGFVESNVQLQLSYKPLLVETVEHCELNDDEDVNVYLDSVNYEKRRCMLFVNVIPSEPQPEQVPIAPTVPTMPIVDQSSVGMNFENQHAKDGEIGPNAIVVYVGKEKAVEGDSNKEGEAESRDEGDEYTEPRPVVEPGKYIEPWDDGLDLTKLQEFPNKKALQDVVDRASFANCFSFEIVKSDKVRYVVKCPKEGCNWGLRGGRIRDTDIFSIRRHNKMHTCSRASQSSSNSKRQGTPKLVASLLHGDYPGQMETPPPKIIMDLVKTKLGVDISYSTALRGKNQAVTDLKGSPEESYKMLRCYLHMLEKVNHGTRSYVHCNENNKFMYLFIALGASIEGFKVMRKVITMDATFLKNGYKGVLVFASAQDPNRHHYPLAFGVLDGENDASWNWFLEMLKTVVGDSSEIVFMTDRNTSLITAIANVYPLAHHGFCIWHLSQNVKGYARNVNKDVVAWRFMECSRFYTVAEFNIAYASFTTRYPSAAKYLEESTQKERWARCVFPGDRYNLDTSNCVESLNSVFKDARRYSLIPMLDAILKKFSEWFNEHRKDVVSGSVANKLVPLVENYLHDLWATAEKLKVIELNGFELEYNVIDSDGKPYLVKLRLRSCSCRFFDIQKYPCVHALASFITFQKYGGKDIELHELCSKYYWTELWAIAYCRTIYLVPDKSRWDVLDEVQDMQIMPPNRKIKGGRKKTKRYASAGEKRPKTRPRTQNKRRRRQGLQWLLFGDNVHV
ncbi:PREDICTED: uncharacterized protein LOC104710991 [Camelina sativa]|uniref:Uncharacterized protein LOC104710991 n=1 Tax=Camelina sativa TaxID=90675 RepID=A0ABM0TG83_CAMSA|nr:PREDICTED: uncharacterized protein LOC104710991 [Camelina sativa]